MKWNNCSPEEAQEAYDSAKSKLNNAADQYVQTRNAMNSLQSERSRAKAKSDTVNNQKINFEKRIEDIERIIQMLGENGPVAEAISDSNKWAQSVQDNFNKQVLCTGISSPEIARAFRTPTVEENADSQAAVAELKKVKARLEQAVADLNSQLNAMDEEMAKLNSQMNSLASTQSDLAKTMARYSFEMNHYKKQC